MREKEEDFSFKQLFVPLTTKKAVTIISAVGMVVFFNALFNGFVWDDTSYILSNTDVHSFSVSKIFGSSYFNKDGFYRPLPALYFTILYAFFAKQAFFYHFFQIILHIMSAILVFRLFKHFFHKEASLILTLFFLVHPVMVESVSFIGASISPLFVFFGLCAVSILIAKKPLTPLRYTAIMLLLFLSILTKEGGVLFFVIILVFAWLFQKKSFLKLLLYESLLVPLYLFLRIGIGRVYLTPIEKMFFGEGSSVTDGRYVPIMELSLIERILMIPSILWYYLKTVFFPVKLAVDQTWVITTYTLYTFYLPLFFSSLFFLLLFAMAWYLYRIKSHSFKAFIFFFIWFVIGMGMHLQLLPLDMTVADRWFYFPFIGLLGIFFIIAEHFFSKNKISVMLGIPLILLFLFSVRTVTRNANFANEITLYSNDRLVENNYEIELNLGSAYGAVGDLDKTEYHYKKSIELFPNEANLDSMGLLSEWKGNFSGARDYYEKARNARGFYLNPQKRLSLTYIRLSYVYLKMNDYTKARDISLEGLQQYPKEHALWLRLAQSEYMLNHHAEALSAINKAKDISADANTINTLMIIEERKPLEIK